MTKSIVFLLMMAIVVGGCHFNRDNALEAPRLVVGIVAAAKYSGWGLNWCSHGEPVKDLYNRPEWNCLTVGGEIYKIRLEKVRSLENGELLPPVEVLVPAAIEGRASYMFLLALVRPEPELQADTGVHSWASDFLFVGKECPNEDVGEISNNHLGKLRAEYRAGPNYEIKRTPEVTLRSNHH